MIGKPRKKQARRLCGECGDSKAFWMFDPGSDRCRTCIRLEGRVKEMLKRQEAGESKICRVCKKLKPLSSYYFHAQMVDCLTSECGACLTKKSRIQRNKNIEHSRKLERARRKRRQEREKLEEETSVAEAKERERERRRRLTEEDERARTVMGTSAWSNHTSKI